MIPNDRLIELEELAKAAGILPDTRNNIFFIAAANPTQVLALIIEIRELRERVKELQWIIEGLKR